MATVGRSAWHSSAGSESRASSRLCSTDEIQWRFYYTQSEGLPPTVCEMHLFRQDENGSFVPVLLSPFACTELASGANGMDPLYKDFSDSRSRLRSSRSMA